MATPTPTESDPSAPDVPTNVTPWWRARLIAFRHRQQFGGEIRAFKSALKLRSKSLELLDVEIRLAHDSLFQRGEVDDDDKLVNDLVQNLISSTGELNTNLENEESIALLEKLRRTNSVKTAVASYHLASAYSRLRTGESGESDHLELAKQADPNATTLDKQSVHARLREVRRRFSTARSAVIDRSALKIEITLADISTLTGVVSVLFLCSGFLSTWFFFNLFGLDVSLFFSLTDYLATSLEQIRVAAYIVIISLISFWAGIRDKSIQSNAQLRTEHRARMIMKRVIQVVVFGSFLLSVWSIYQEKPNFTAMLITKAIGSYLLAFWIAETFFKSPFKVGIALSGVFLFLGHIGTSAYERAYNLQNALTKKTANSIVMIKDASNGLATPAPGELIAANGSYVFLLQENRRTIKAIPKDRVETITVEKIQ